MQKSKISLSTAVFMIIANTIGTGVFTSLGFQLEAFSNPVAIMLLWLIGGLLALCGAFIYSELESRFPGSGGETHFAEKLYGPLWGFLAGWTSLIAGFAMPIAVTAYACSRYLLPHGSSDAAYLTTSALLIMGVGTLNSFSTQAIGKIQNFFVILKILMILSLSFLLFSKSEPTAMPTWRVDSDLFKSLFNSAFATSLVYVSFAYSGWNAVIYVAKQIDNKAQNLPKAMFYGTGITIFLYLLFNMSLMLSTPHHLLVGKLEVASAAANYHFHENGLRALNTLLTLSLFTCLTSLIWGGSNVFMRCADSHPLFHWMLFKKNDCLMRSTFSMSALSIFILYTIDFEKIIMATGFLLVFFSLLCSWGLVWQRSIKKIPSKATYKASLYPLSAFFFILTNLWIGGYLLISEKSAVLISCIVLGIGLAVYKLQTRLKSSPSGETIFVGET